MASSKDSPDSFERVVPETVIEEVDEPEAEDSLPGLVTGEVNVPPQDSVPDSDESDLDCSEHEGGAEDPPGSVDTDVAGI
jgi:hypothetical protein